MIDNIALEVLWRHKAFGNELTSIHADSKDKFNWNKHVMVSDKYPWAKLRVTSKHHGGCIRIEGSFANYLQGHNAFGTNDLIALCRATVESVLSKLDIPRTRPRLWAAINDAELFRVDVTGGFKLNEATDVPLTIRALKIYFLGYPGKVMSYGDESIYVDPSRKTISSKFYCKSTQVKETTVKHWVKHAFADQQLVMDYVESLLRFEVSCHRRWLLGQGLVKAQDWSPATVKGILNDELATLKLKGNITKWEHSEITDELSGALRRVFVHWLSGHNLSDLYQPRALANHKKALRAYGIDITNPPPRNAESIVDLSEILVAEDMRKSYPKRAREDGKVAAVHP